MTSKREAEVQGNRDGWFKGAAAQDQSGLVPQRASAAAIAKRKIATGRAPRRQFSTHTTNLSSMSSTSDEPSKPPFADGSLDNAINSLQQQRQQNGQFQGSMESNNYQQQANLSSGPIGFGNTNNSQPQGIAPPNSAFNFSIAGTAPINNPFSTAANTTSNAANPDYPNESNFVGFNGNMFFVPNSSSEEGARLRAARKLKDKGKAPQQWSRIRNVPFDELTPEEKEEFLDQKAAEEARHLRKVDEESGSHTPAWAPHSPFHPSASNSSFTSGTPAVGAFTGTTARSLQPSFNSFSQGTDQSQSFTNTFSHQEGSQQAQSGFNQFNTGVNQQQIQTPGNFFGQASSHPQSSGFASNAAPSSANFQLASTPFGQNMDVSQESRPTSNIFGQSMNQSQSMSAFSGQNQEEEDSPMTDSSLSSTSSHPFTSTFLPTTAQHQQPLPSSNIFSQQQQTPTTSSFSGFSGFQPNKPTANLFGNMNTSRDEACQPDRPLSPQDAVMLSPPESTADLDESIQAPIDNMFGVISESQPDVSMEEEVRSTTSMQSDDEHMVPIEVPRMIFRRPHVSRSIASVSDDSGPEPYIIEARTEDEDYDNTKHGGWGIHRTKLNPSSSNKLNTKASTSGSSQGENYSSQINSWASVKTPSMVPQPTSNTLLSSSSPNTTTVEPMQSTAVPRPTSHGETTQSDSSVPSPHVQSLRNREQLMTLMPPNIPDHLTEEQRAQYVTAYRLRSLDVGLQKRVQSTQSFSADSEVMQFYEMMKQRILSAGAGQIISPGGDGSIEEASSHSKQTNVNGLASSDTEAGPSAPESPNSNSHRKRRADEAVNRESSNGVADNRKKARGDTEISYPTLPSQGSETSKLFASITNGGTNATRSKESTTNEERVTNKTATFSAMNNEASSSTKPPTFNAPSFNSSNDAPPNRPLFPTSGGAASSVSNSSSSMAQSMPSAVEVVDGSKASHVSNSSTFVVPGTGSENNRAGKEPSILSSGNQTNGSNASTTASNTANAPAFKIPNFGASQNMASASSVTPAFNFGSTDNKASEPKSQPVFKVPTFGAANNVSSGTANPPINFMAQFGKKAEDDARKEKEKRKAEEFDSDDDEAEWERKDAEAQRAKKQKLAEQIANATKTKAWTFNPNTNSNIPSQASTNFIAQFGKKAEEDAQKEKAKRKAEEYDSDEDDEAEWERNYEEAQRLKKQKLAEQIAESPKTQKWSFKPSEAKSEQTKPSSGASSPSKLDNVSKPSSASSGAPFSAINPTSSVSMGKSIFSALNKSNSQNTIRDDNIFGKYSNPGSDVEGNKSGNADNEESEASDEDAEKAPSQDASTKTSTSASYPSPFSSSNMFSPNNTSTETTAKEDSKPVPRKGRSLFDRIEHDENGVAKRGAPATEEKKSDNPFSHSQPANSSSLFSQASKGSSNPFTQSLVGQANSNPKTGNLFALPSSTGVSPTISKTSSSTSNFAGFGSSTSPKGDHTWKPESPIKFGVSSFAPAFNVTGTSPAKSANNEQKGNVASPFSGLFGSPKSGTIEAPVQPPSNLFGNAPAKPATGVVGFGFGGPPKPVTGNLLAAPSGFTSHASSRATSPGITTGGESAAESTVEGAEDLMEHHEQINLAAGGPGEADEDVLFEAKAKAQEFDTDKKEWVVRGIGSLRVLKHRETSKTRILMRQIPSGKIVLNAALMGAMKYEHTGEKRVKFGAATGSGKLANWVVQLGKKENALKLSALLEENKSY